ncbi:MAG TPA: DUF4783 domain-containing protein [Thermoanaerobaculia bacterium]|nr:DUF4783 domain-containing protein [Thermoanaerobaculia bacterium]
MKLWRSAAFIILLFVPVVASAQYRDLDSAMSNLARGFERGQTQNIIEGISTGDKINLEFPGLVTESGFFGRDQASYLLDELFNKTKPTGFERRTARGGSSSGAYNIKASWTVSQGERDLYITLKEQDGRWLIVSIRSAGR